MIILREGKEIELRSDELYNAYLEQKNIFEIQNIEDNMERYLDEEELEILKDNKQFIEEVKNEFKRNQNKYDMGYESAIIEAFSHTKKKYLDCKV